MARRKKQDDTEAEIAEATTEVERPALTLAGHPRATGQIRTVRSAVALVAFVGVLLLSLRSGVVVESALLRALEAGVIGFVFAWAAMVMAWRQLAEAEIDRKSVV